jgi:predicted aconitase/predicted aconitase with swiveling domain
LSEAARRVLPGVAAGPVIASSEALSFWGGVDPATARVIDVHHPLCGASLAGSVLMLPTSRGSCSGSGVWLDLALNGRAPAALLLGGPEDTLTLGALAAAEMFGKTTPVLRLGPDAFRKLSQERTLRINQTSIEGDGVVVAIAEPPPQALELSDADRAMLAGDHGPAVRQAMRIVCAMAEQQGAAALIDVTQAHIDGCIYASPANLAFAERMVELGARVRVQTTMNAISVVHGRWREQGVAAAFGAPATRLADAYVQMGCRPTFTCAPYLLDTAPTAGENIGWAESNAVVFANSVLAARTAKHPDFLDLCIALTGRAPLAGAYLDAGRRARRIIDVECPDGADDSFWPLIGYLAGRASPDRIPLLRLRGARPGRDDLKALCAAFATTSAAPMLHIEGVTPEAGLAAAADADRATISRADMAAAWASLNQGPDEIELVAIGSPHASLDECRALAAALGGRRVRAALIVTAGKDVIAAARSAGVLAALEASGVAVLPDLCWCSISEPVYPTQARTVMTNSCKYAHYGPGLHGRKLRYSGLADCVEAAMTGRAPPRLPRWLA